MRNAIWKYEKLNRLLEGDFPLARRWAFEKLVQLYGHSRVRRIADLIDDPDDYISCGAIRFLSSHHHRKWAFRILRKFQESSGDVASSCAVALGELHYTGAVHVFREQVESEKADFETLSGIITALKMMPSEESTALLLLLGEMYSAASNGVFLSGICDALLATRNAEAVTLVASLYLERSFSFDDKGHAVLKEIIHHTDSAEFLEEFRSFVNGQSFDVLNHIKQKVRYKLGEILGDDFVRKTAEKSLKMNYLQLLGDIEQAAEMALYSRRIVDGDNKPAMDDLSRQELLNYHFIDEVAAEPRRLHVMGLGEVKKVLVLCICAMLRIVYPRRNGSPSRNSGADEVKQILDELETVEHPENLIRHITGQTLSARKAAQLRTTVTARLAKSSPEATVRYVQLLAKLKPEKNLEMLWNYLKVRVDDAVCQAAEDAMVAAGKDAVDFIEKKFSGGDESQKMFAFGILSRIPIAKSVNLIIRYMDEMWENFRDFVLYAVNELGSSRFVPPVLEKLESAPAPDLEETYLLLCELNGIQDERIVPARQRVLQALESAENLDGIECDRSKALRRNHCNRKLICRQCSLSRIEAL